MLVLETFSFFFHFFFLMSMSEILVCSYFCNHLHYNPSLDCAQVWWHRIFLQCSCFTMKYCLITGCVSHLPQASITIMLHCNFWGAFVVKVLLRFWKFCGIFLKWNIGNNCAKQKKKSWYRYHYRLLYTNCL